MKLIIENWNNYLNKEEEVIEEGPGATLAGLGLALGIGGGGNVPDAPAPEPTQDTQTQQVQTNQLTKTASGQSSITIAIPGLAELGTNGFQIATDVAQEALAKALGTTKISAEVTYLDDKGNLTGPGWDMTGKGKPVYATATTHSKGPTN